MSKRNPVSTIQNIWSNAQQVDDSDLNIEQNYNTITQSSIINNHIGTGVLPEVLLQKVLFDSLLSNSLLDGLAIQTQNQPTDNNLGNQLEIELISSKVSGKKTIKLCVIGLDFSNNLQYEIFYFKTNEIQVSYKHFVKILLILFNDFIGDKNLSLNLGGRLIIRESKPLTLSRDSIMNSQDIEPNLFFRDFFIDGNISLQTLLKNALPLYNIDNLNIFTAPLDNKVLSNGDVVMQIGQKFIATTNNIQKITLLLSARNLDAGYEDDLIWNGDLIVSIYPLQSMVENYFDIVPNLAIDFSPSNIPIAQISTNYLSLQSSGIILDSVPQPVDFIFSNSSIAAGNILNVNSYYAFTIKRSGSANKCDILISSGSDKILNSRITIFTGTLWVDLPDQDLWFRIWTDAAKISDGQAYDSGNGIIVPKTNGTSDYSLENLQFVGNNIFRGVISADIEKTVPITDQRTGEPILSRKQFVPKINLLNNIDIVNLETTSDPLIIGAIADKNRKFYDSLSSIINSKLYSATLAKDELIIKIVDDPTDLKRFDTTVSGLLTNLLNGDFVGAKIYPDAGDTSIFYRIASAKLISSILGDVNGDGIIDENDLNILNSYLDFNLNVGLSRDSSVITDGYTTTAVNGYTALTNMFTNMFNLSFQIINKLTGNVIASANDGIIVSNPTDNRLAQFTSSSVEFNSIIGLTSYKLVILSPLNKENYGMFDIIANDALTDVLTIRKVFLTGDVIMQMLRADIDEDFMITLADGYLLQNYIDKYPLNYSQSDSFAGPSTNPFTKIGTKFNTIRLKLEKFIDRDDDYSVNNSDRANDIHISPDIFLADGYFYNHDFYNAPVKISFLKQLTWDESLVITNSSAKLVPTIFINSSDMPSYKCIKDGVSNVIYGSPLEFDPGRVDIFAPKNIIIGPGGELQNSDGNFYKVDFEVGTIVLEIPDGLFGSERTINIFDDFISDYTGDGRTRLGFPAMKFADCSYVVPNSLVKDQLRFSVSIQSFSPNTNGLSEENYSGAIVDGKIGIAMDYQTGLLTLNFTNLFEDEILKTLNTKVQIHVFLKKGGFNNKPLLIDSLKMQNMLKLISVFSGAVDGGPSALVDLSSDVTGILPIIHGGTGLGDVGLTGTVLTSTGAGLSYQFISDIIKTIASSSGVSDAGKVTKTDGYGLLDSSFYYKNPVHIYGFAGLANISTDSTTITIVGGLQFRFDEYITQGIKSIKLEAIMSTGDALNPAQIRLFDETNSVYLNLVGISSFLTSSSINYSFVSSDDISPQLLSLAHDYVYELHFSQLTASFNIVSCLMARLTITYNNP